MCWGGDKLLKSRGENVRSNETRVVELAGGVASPCSSGGGGGMEEEIDCPSVGPSGFTVEVPRCAIWLGCTRARSGTILVRLNMVVPGFVIFFCEAMMLTCVQ